GRLRGGLDRGDASAARPEVRSRRHAFGVDRTPGCFLLPAVCGRAVDTRSGADVHARVRPGRPEVALRGRGITSTPAVPTLGRRNRRRLQLAAPIPLDAGRSVDDLGRTGGGSPRRPRAPRAGRDPPPQPQPPAWAGGTFPPPGFPPPRWVGAGVGL